MKTIEKNDKSAILTVVGMTAMIALTAVKAATSFPLAASALIVSGIAFFFIAEALAKTPDAESGLSFRRFLPDLKKPG